MNIALCVPTLNAAATATEFLSALRLQELVPGDCLAIDSASDDSTSEQFSEAGFRVLEIPRNRFNHGGTRRLAVEECASADIIIFMTQDAILSDADALSCLLRAFEDPQIGAAYGRQLPAPGATPFAAHARLFNYPRTSRVNTFEDAEKIGIKATFISNSFAAYRVSALDEVGSFPEHCLVSEDTYVTARMLQAGWSLAYCAEAKVLHSHNYSMTQEFSRYFDVGVFHSRNPWILEKFGAAEGEGRRFVLSEVKYLLRSSPSLILLAVIRTFMKYLGFRLGLCEKFLPKTLKSRLSMQPSFWLQEVLGRHES